MPLHYHGETDAGYVLIAGHGHIELADWASAIAAQIADDRWRMPTLLDISDPFAVLSIAQTGAAIIRSVRELINEHGPRGPLAMVLGNRELYDEGRSYLQTFRKALPHRIEIFSSRAEAIAWLGEPDDEPRQA